MPISIGRVRRRFVKDKKPTRLPTSQEAKSVPAVEFWIGMLMLKFDLISVVDYAEITEYLQRSQFFKILSKDIERLRKKVKTKVLSHCSDFNLRSIERLKLDSKIALKGKLPPEFNELFTGKCNSEWLDLLEMYAEFDPDEKVLAAAYNKLYLALDTSEFWEETNIVERYKKLLKLVDSEETTIFPLLTQWYEKLEDQLSGGLFTGKFSVNLKFLSECYGLTNEESKIFGLLLLVISHRTIINALNFFDYSTKGLKLVKEIIGNLLSIENVDSIFNQKTSIAFFDFSDYDSTTMFCDFDSYISYKAPCPIDFLINGDLSFKWLVENTLKKEEAPTLSLENFNYLSVIKGLVLPYLESVVRTSPKGVNILLYGPSGTGKTELSKVLASSVGLELYSPIEEEIEKESSKEGRFHLWKKANAFLKNNPASAILIDEGDDFFNYGLREGVRSNKYYINTELENNPRPTFWTVNSIKNIDPSMIRRFHLVIEVSNPPKSYLRSLACEKFKNYLSPQNINRIAETEYLSPAVLSQTAGIVQNLVTIGKKVDEDQVMKMVSSILLAQGFSRVAKKKSISDDFEPSLSNVSCNLNSVLKGLKTKGSGRLCLYGPPGTGKTAFGKWIAKELERPINIKKASDLLDCYVGMTEQNIANAFETAEREDAVLLIDEVDSFLRTRGRADHSWEVTQVNEFLTQLETFEGIVIVTTNLMDILDDASMRRFDLKVKFEYLTSKQSVKLFSLHCEELGIVPGEEDIKEVSRMKNLTPGDFKAASRQMNFVEEPNCLGFLKALEDQIRVKHVNRTIGFV